MQALMNNEFTNNSSHQADRELNMLYEVSSAMRTTLALDHILYIILTGVTSHSGLGYNRAVLFLLNQNSRSLECQMVIGPESGEHAVKIWDFIENAKQGLDDLIHEDQVKTTIAESFLFKTLKDLKFPLNAEPGLLLTDAYRRATPWHLKADDLIRYSQDPFVKSFKSKELVIMPMSAKGKINGLIVADNFYNQRPITGEDFRIFMMLAGQAGLAIENSRLYEMIVQKSHMDSLTNLWNHGYFQELLNESILTAQRNRQPLGLLMIDIDNFKALNDTHGHQAGDDVLTEIAQILKEHARETDYICRYGGEEFSVILQSANRRESLEIAEQIRTIIAQHKFHSSHLPKDLKITVSIGIASFPDDGDRKEKIVTEADKAMYIAKFSGKNKSCLAGN